MLKEGNTIKTTCNSILQNVYLQQQNQLNTANMICMKKTLKDCSRKIMSAKKYTKAFKRFFFWTSVMETRSRAHCVPRTQRCGKTDAEIKTLRGLF